MNPDVHNEHPEYRIFYLNGFGSISPISSVKSVQIRYGENIFANQVNLVSATHCGRGTNLRVFEDVNKPLFLLRQ